MTPPNTTPLDPVAAATAIFTVMFGPHMAYYVGPYAVILMGASVGTAWSLGRREPVTSNNSAFNYFLLMCATALIFTVPLAEWLGAKLGSADSQWLFGPVAMLIGGVGSDWPRLLQWIGRRFIERKAGQGEEK